MTWAATDRPVCVLEAQALTGESPVWVPEEQALYWTDIPGKTLNRFDPASGENRVWPMPEEVGSFALRERGGLMAALRSGFALIDLDSGAHRAPRRPRGRPSGEPLQRWPLRPPGPLLGGHA